MMRRRLLAVPVTLAVMAVTVTTTAITAQGQTASCSVTSADQAVDAQEQQLLSLVNQYRASYGKKALALQPDVTRAASWFSRDMASKNYFPSNHVDSNGRDPGQRLTWCGASWSNWGENIYGGSPNAQDAFNAWRSSPGHNANLLRDGVTSAGIARAYGVSTYWYWTLDVTNTPPSTTTTPVPAPTTTTLAPPTTTTTVAPRTTTLPPTTTIVPRTTTTTTVPVRRVCPPQYAALCARYGIF